MDLRAKSLSLIFLVLIVVVGCARKPSEKFKDENLPDMLSPDEVAQEIGEAPEAKSQNQPNKEARLQIIVDKARGGFNLTAQTMKVYLDGRLLYHWPVSTGREQWEESVSGKRYFSRTPVGRFRIYRRAKDYFSHTWQAPMPYAQFLIGGIAIHATTKSHYKELGSRASGGCIRVRLENAVELWNLVNEISVRETLITVYNSSIHSAPKL